MSPEQRERAATNRARALALKAKQPCFAQSAASTSKESSEKEIPPVLAEEVTQLLLAVILFSNVPCALFFRTITFHSSLFNSDLFSLSLCPQAQREMETEEAASSKVKLVTLNFQNGPL